MDLVSRYFESLVFFKVERKENYVIYAASINSSYGDGKKQYVIAFVLTNFAIPEKCKLSNLPWQNIQTRVLENGWKIPKQNWKIPQDLPNPLFDLQSRDDFSSTYHLAYGNSMLEMILKHDPKKRSKYQYHTKMNLIASLMTFRCVISEKMTQNQYLQPSGAYVPPNDSSYELIG
jgi:hypothetical protein